MKKLTVVDHRISDISAASLERLGYELVPTVPIDTLYDEVRGHADMQLHIANGKAICAPDVYEYYKNKLRIPVVCGSLGVGAKYPFDIAYNTCAVGSCAVCKRSHTAPEILSEYDTILNTKQGYAKCSICVVNDISAITADEGVYRLMKKNGLNVLKISPCDIDLYNMNGFIGGASGLVEERLLVFNGDIKTHRDHKAIEDFCKAAGVEIECLSSGRLADIGTVICVPITP